MGTDAHNPYLAARLAWNERYMALARSIRNWQLIAGGLLLTTCGLSAGLVYVSSQQQVQPYVVEVDAAGVAKAVADLRPHAVLDPLVVGAQLRRFILDLRSVSLDEAATRRQINAAYQQCLQEAQHWIAGQYRGRSLADLMAKGRIFPVNIVLAPITPKTWRARWKEQTIGHDGTLVDESEYEATIEVPPVWHPHQPAQSAWETPGRPRTNGLVGGQRAFWQRASGAGTGQWLEASIQPPHSPYTLQAGTVVPAVLTQAITSDLEGQISALVTQDVYDSATGRFLLIPQGSRLFGFYDTDLQATQPRLHLSFKTLYFPNGYSLALHGMPGVDGRGLAGASDQVNRHFFQRYGSAAVLSLITAGITLATYNRGGFFSYSPEDAAVYGAGTVLGRAVGEDLRRVMHIRPTLTIREAYPFNVVVTQDAVFPGPYPFHAAARHGGGHP